MKVALLAGFIALTGPLLLSVQKSAAQSESTEPSPAARNTVALTTYPLPMNLTEFGNRTAGMIRVTIYGEVNRPGIYYLSPGTVVRDAIQTVRGTTDFAGWPYTLVVRPLNGEKAELIRFTRQAKPEDSVISLKEGDRLYFGHESF